MCLVNKKTCFSVLKNISPVGLGRLMVKLYPEVKSKQERLISEWNKRESVFHGVQWRVED
jgi:hypothetical protein